MKVVLKVLGTVFLLIIVVAAAGMFYISRGLEEGLNVKINPIDLANIEDGVYKGSYDFGRWSNELNVTVENHKITNLEVTDDMMIANPDVKNELIQRVINEQKTTVDAVSGGTVSSKAYLKSIENALNN